MNTAMEYLLLSTLSYANFKDIDSGYTLEELLYGEERRRDRIIKYANNFLGGKRLPHIRTYFGSILNEWKVFYVDNRTSISKKMNNSGFYAVIFKKEDKYVIAYRGSERFPIEDAYKDFIETDLTLGMGKKPRQFTEGYEVYKTLIDKFKVNSEEISLTGHSLGGGIAQFVALMADKDDFFIPYTVTWNAVGINKNGIIGLDDFIDYEEILKASYDFKSSELKALMECKDNYLDFLMGEIKRRGHIKSKSTVLQIEESRDFQIEVDSSTIESFIKKTKIDRCLKNTFLLNQKHPFNLEGFVKKSLNIPNLKKKLKDARDFIEKINENRSYNELIINFCHSKDLTVSLFDHVGSVYLVDKYFEEKQLKRSKFFKNIFLLTKSIKDYHFEDVFVPFLITSGDKRGRFSQNLNLDYLASLLRRVISYERDEDKELLIRYYKLEVLKKEDVTRLKDLIIKAFRSKRDELLYIDQGIEMIEKISEEEMVLLWEKTKRKLVAPYESTDLYDALIFLPLS